MLRFNINLTKKCNLNCKSCGTYAPLAKEVFYDIEIYKKDVTRIAQLTNSKIEAMVLIGGEPLLHPRLIEFIEFGRNLFTGAEIVIVTNGLLLAKQSEEFWKCCGQNNVEIKITKYPIKYNEILIKNLAKKYKVSLAFITINEWLKNNIDLGGSQNIQESYNRCNSKTFCSTVENGKFCTCNRPFVIKEFTSYFKQDISIAESNFVDIHKIHDVKEIYDYLKKPIPFCKYCGIPISTTWGISKKEISEWVST
jgi:organic radical activating enzyme